MPVNAELTIDIEPTVDTVFLIDMEPDIDMESILYAGLDSDSESESDTSECVDTPECVDTQSDTESTTDIPTESTTDTCMCVNPPNYTEESKPSISDPYVYQPEAADYKTFNDFFELINDDPIISHLPMTRALTGSHMTIEAGNTEIVVACRGSTIILINWSRYTEYIEIDSNIAFSGSVFLKYNNIRHVAEVLHKLICLLIGQSIQEEYQYQ